MAKKQTKKKATTPVEKVAGSPGRPEQRFYRGAHPGTSVEEITGRKNFRPGNDFIDDSDDDQEILADLTEAGVESPFDEEARKDRHRDREYQLQREGTEESSGNLEDEDQDLNKLPHTGVLKAERNL